MLGTAAGRVVPQAIALMAAEMKLNEAELDKMLKESSESERAGGEAGERVPWAKHGKRVMKMSKFFSDEAITWKAATVLIATSVADRLHFSLLGHARGSRATLTKMVDPFESVVARALATCALYMSQWRLSQGSPWLLLTWVGVRDGEHLEVPRRVGYR